MMNQTKTVLVYDINTLPDGKEMSDVMESFEANGIMLFDSKKGNAPYVIHMNLGTQVSTK